MTGTYETGAGIPKGADNYATFCEADGKIYTVASKKLYIYDPVTNTWDSSATPPNVDLGYGLPKSIHIGDKIYIMGVGEPKNKVSKNYIYDIKMNTWSLFNGKPHTTGNFGAAAIGKRIYCFGGHQYEDGQSKNYVDIYDTQTNTWSQGKNMPYDLQGVICVTVGNVIHCIGGTNIGSQVKPYIFNNHECYDTTTNTWESWAPLPTALWDKNGILFQNNICCIGYQSNKPYFHIFDLETMRWGEGPQPPVAVSYSWFCEINGILYIMDRTADTLAPLIFTPDTVEEPEQKKKLRIALLTGRSQNLTSLHFPGGITLKDVDWTSADSNIAAVDENGRVSAISAGLTEITATAKDGSWSDSVLVQVIKTEGKITILMDTGDFCQLFSWDGAGTVTWTSDKPDIAAVSDDGLVTALSAGLALVTVTGENGDKDEIHVKVLATA